MAYPVANVVLTDTFNAWFNKTIQAIVNVNDIIKGPGDLTANNISIVAGGMHANSAGLKGRGFHFQGNTISVTSNTAITGANTDIKGGVFLVTSNTNFNPGSSGTVKINVTAISTENDSILFAIALG